MADGESPASVLTWLFVPLLAFWLPSLLIPAGLLSAIFLLRGVIRAHAANLGRLVKRSALSTFSTSRRRAAASLRGLQSTPIPAAPPGTDVQAPLPLHLVHPAAPDATEILESKNRQHERALGVRLPSRGPRERDRTKSDYQVLTIANNKGGVAKTTLAVNLAVYIRALREDLPILLVSFDDQSLPNRMFSLDADPPRGTVKTGMLEGSLASVIRMGEYGVEYVPSDPDVGSLKRCIESRLHLCSVLARTGFKGLVIIDTKSDLEILTQNAIEASDLTIVPVTDQESLIESDRLYDLLDEWQLPRERARIALTLVDLRVRYREGEQRDILGHLISEIRKRGRPLFESFVSRSSKIQSLYTNPSGSVFSILHGAPKSLINQQMQHLADEVLASLDATKQTAASNTAPVAWRRIAATPSSVLAMSDGARSVGAN